MASFKANGDPLEGTLTPPGTYPAANSVAMFSSELAYGVGNKLMDRTAPAAVTLTSPSHAATTVDLAWNAVTDSGSGITSYDVYKAGVKLTSITDGSLTYHVTGLVTATAYTFTVKVVDGAGNVSAASNTVSVTTS